MSDQMEITLMVNGEQRTERVEARMLLSDFLRHQLGLTGTHVGCEQGVCGACTVLLNGTAVRSCLMLAIQARDNEVRTVESLAKDGELSTFQQMMMVEHGLQCGFCTPGILMSVAAAEEAGLPSEYVLSEMLDGHVCRCTGYNGIRAAIKQRFSQLQEQSE